MPIKPTLAVSTLALVTAFGSIAVAQQADDTDVPTHIEHVTVPEGISEDALVDLAAGVVPSQRQLDHLNRRFTAFIHIGPNTFTGREWGNGLEDPNIFQPEGLDTDQWCAAMVAAGMTQVVITVKHHDGFCLWQTRYEDHQSVRGTSWQDGQGDVLRDLAESCREHGLELGVYLSPADLYQIESEGGLYGNGSEVREQTIPLASDRPFEDERTFTLECDDYNAYFMSQLFELLTEYGPISEVWFDGANPKPGTSQSYNRAEWYDMIRDLAPEAVIFGGPDVRWCGNEAGGTRQTEWNIMPIRESVWMDRTAADLGSRRALANPRPQELRYMLAETNTSIRAGWFWRNDTEQAVRTPEDVFDIYERSVGGNSVFLLNIPPNDQGLFSPRDVACLEEVGRMLRETYDVQLTEGATADGAEAVLDGDPTTFWQANAGTGAIEIRLPEVRSFNRIVLDEATATHGQRIESHAVDAWVDGAWQEIISATTVGHRRILRFQAVTSDRIRVRIAEGRAQPTLAHVGVHFHAARPPALSTTRDGDGQLVLIPQRPSDFGWKPHGQSEVLDLPEVRFTLDGSEPTSDSTLYEGPLDLPLGGHLRARSFADGQAGPELARWIGISPEHLSIADATPGHNADYAPERAIDGDPATFWHTSWAGGEANAPRMPHHLSLDLGQPRNIRGLSYLPRQDRRVPDSMVEAGRIEISQDGESWIVATEFELGNLLNDPSQRLIAFETPAEARYIRFVATRGAQDKPYAGAAEIGVILQPE